MPHDGQLDFYDVVKKYLDRLLTKILDEALLKLINMSIGGVTQAMQMAANMALFECVYDLFFRHATQLLGIALRMAKREMRLFPLTNCDVTEEMLSGLLKKKGGNEYVHEMIIFLETLLSTAQQILPVQVLKRVLQDVMFHISEMIVGALLRESVKRFNVNDVVSGSLMSVLKITSIVGVTSLLRLVEFFLILAASNYLHWVSISLLEIGSAFILKVARYS
ncbi:hypothetical protein K7X08_002753 [Anisodus acutangulus]|uniref:Exocyst complex subunit EXOC6/Sec15 C-terminal domain-containing protein n=1 Tax=Anisodus acutangulus TaxID=402998 RepID=A0A9Q1RF36_9SOLA|nr:hypothetical protein K7X08_002753 [Anisodus acutangulus]